MKWQARASHDGEVVAYRLIDIDPDPGWRLTRIEPGYWEVWRGHTPQTFEWLGQRYTDADLTWILTDPEKFIMELML